MAQVDHTEEAELRHLSLEEMEQVSGGDETILEYIYAFIAVHTGSIYKGPLR